MNDYTQDPDAPPFVEEPVYRPPSRSGGDLTPQDLRNLEARWITPECARQAKLRRVNDTEGAGLVGRGPGNYAGIAIPYFLPGVPHSHNTRLRRDKPDVEYKNGEMKDRGKYMAAPGYGNSAYFPVDVFPDMLTDAKWDAVITEGEFKAIALQRLTEFSPKLFLPIGLAGVWNWRGTIGKVTGANGERLNLKGVIPDIERVAWEGRRVIIAFDADAEQNESVAAGRRNLAGALRERGAMVAVVTWDVSRGKGIDDLLAAEGPAPVLEILANAKYQGSEEAAEDKAQAEEAAEAEALAVVTAEVDGLIAAKDSQGCYAPAFIEKCAPLDDGSIFDVGERLKKSFKDFKIKEWKRRIQAEREVTEEFSSPNITGWECLLLRNKEKAIVTCHENVALYMENDPVWQGVVGYNEFTGAQVILKQPPYPITAKVGQELEDHFDTEAVRWFERRGVMAKPETVRRVVDSVSRKFSYHPVRDFLNALAPWDGVPRIGSWLIDYMGVKSSDTEPNLYAMSVGGEFLISAVARVMNPGCKADHLLILEGKQGIGKSTSVRVLAGDDWFTNQLADMGSKDASMQVRGVWIIELSELDSLGRVEMTRAKNFMDNQVEMFRLPYGKRIVRQPRQCVFIGTTNQENWLKDETGGRRFWPAKCLWIDIPGLIRDREQLWAEALKEYRSGKHWWIEDEEIKKLATEEQRQRYQDDVWMPKIREARENLEFQFISGAREGTVSVADILLKLGVETPKQDQAMANRVARCLVADGWEKWRAPRDDENRREWRYRKKPELS